MAIVDTRQIVDEVRVFDITAAIKKRDHLSGRVDMARSPNSFVGVFQTRPRAGEPHVHQHPDSPDTVDRTTFGVSSVLLDE